MRAIVLTAVLLMTGCLSHTKRAALEIERGLAAGNANVNAENDIAIEVCRAKDLPTPELREDCVAVAVEIADQTEIGAGISVDALRAYWTAVAADDRTGAAAAIVRLAIAIDSLPPKYFAGVQRMVGRLR